MSVLVKMLNYFKPTVKITTTNKNSDLKRELLERGYFVKEIGQEGEIDYLIVSCAPPKDVNSCAINQDNSTRTSN